jgi:nucleoside phosphorylase
MLLIHTALPFEAHRLIRRFEMDQQATPANGRLYLDPAKKIALLVAGMSKHATLSRLDATRAWSRAQGIQVSQICSIGIAGSLTKQAQPGTLYAIKNSCLHVNGEFFSVSRTPRLFPEANLLTVESVISDPNAIQNCSFADEIVTLVDMEGFHVVERATNTFGLKTQKIDLYKVVSDHADGTMPEWKSFAKTYDAAIDNLIDTVLCPVADEKS